MMSADGAASELAKQPPLPPLPPPASCRSVSVSRSAIDADEGGIGAKRPRAQDGDEICVEEMGAKRAAAEALAFLEEKKRASQENIADEAQEKGKDSTVTQKQFHSRTVDRYEIIRQVGLGTYGEVYKARDRSTGEIVALKKIIVHDAREGYPVTALREIKIMQQLKHKNILELKEIVPSSTQLNESDLGTVYMVLEYLDNDLTGILENKKLALSSDYVKCYMKQMLEGIHYIHTNRIVHRDLKAANILVSNDSRLKIGDWGLSRSLKRGNNKYTTKVVTLWYRAPELLLGVQHYTPAIDVWAVGCIFAELLGRNSILPGENDADQLKRIFELCGTPTEETWPGVSQTAGFKHLKPEKFESSFEKRFSWMKPLELDLLKSMLVLDPRKRITAEKALDHDYFWKDNLPCNPENLPRLGGDGLHEFEIKEKRKIERKEKEDRMARGGRSRGGYYHSSRSRPGGYPGNGNGNGPSVPPPPLSVSTTGHGGQNSAHGGPSGDSGTPSRKRSGSFHKNKAWRPPHHHKS